MCLQTINNSLKTNSDVKLKKKKTTRKEQSYKHGRDLGVHTLCAGSLYAASRRTSLDTQEIVRQYWPLKDTEKHTKEHIFPNFTSVIPSAFSQYCRGTYSISLFTFPEVGKSNNMLYRFSWKRNL